MAGNASASSTNPSQTAARRERDRPARQQREQGGGSGQRAAQVVQHFPAAERRDRPCARRPKIHGSNCQSPRIQRCRRDAATSMCDGKSSNTSMSLIRPQRANTTLEQVMAEDRVFRHPALQRGFEGVDVVDALAGEIALAEQILIDVGDRAGVRIDATRHRKRCAETRSSRAIEGSVGVMRGWNSAVTFHHLPRVRDRRRGLFSGCAAVPTRRRTVSIGRRVSASRVMT